MHKKSMEAAAHFEKVGDGDDNFEDEDISETGELKRRAKQNEINIVVNQFSEDEKSQKEMREKEHNLMSNSNANKGQFFLQNTILFQ